MSADGSTQWDVDQVDGAPTTAELAIDARPFPGSVRGPKDLDLAHISIDELRAIRHPARHAITECEICLLFTYALSGADLFEDER